VRRRYDDDAVGIGMNNVAGMDLHRAASLSRHRDRHVYLAKRPQPLVAHGTGKCGKHRQSQVIELPAVPNAAIGDHSGAAADLPTQCNIAADHRTDLVTAGRDHRHASSRDVPVHFKDRLGAARRRLRFRPLAPVQAQSESRKGT
jgi:hypothetical protein